MLVQSHVTCFEGDGAVGPHPFLVLNPICPRALPPGSTHLLRAEDHFVFSGPAGQLVSIDETYDRGNSTQKATGPVLMRSEEAGVPAPPMARILTGNVLHVLDAGSDQEAQSGERRGQTQGGKVMRLAMAPTKTDTTPPLPPSAPLNRPTGLSLATTGPLAGTGTLCSAGDTIWPYGAPRSSYSQITYNLPGKTGRKYV